MEVQQKDKWDKSAIILRAVGGLFTALAVAAIGFFGNDILEKRQKEENRHLEKIQQEEMRIRLYTELISKREESESALRKDMFKSIIESFLKPGSDSLDEEAQLNEKILLLELLAYNFHESLNLEPLFLYFSKLISNSSPYKSIEKQEYLKRLQKIAREINTKQVAALAEVGKWFEIVVVTKELKSDEKNIATFPSAISLLDLFENSVTVDGISRDIQVLVLEADSGKKELKVSLTISTQTTDSTSVLGAPVVFWVGFFDFPLHLKLVYDEMIA
jgi:hypothetical protein